VLPLIEDNIAANGVGTRADGRGHAEAHVLEWGADGYEAVVHALAQPRPDWVLACDTCYIDPVRGDVGVKAWGGEWTLGFAKLRRESRSAQGDASHSGQEQLPHFIAACKGLMGPNTIFLLAFEPRSAVIVDGLLAALHAAFRTVERVPSSKWQRKLAADHVQLYRILLLAAHVQRG